MNKKDPTQFLKHFTLSLLLVPMCIALNPQAEARPYQISAEVKSNQSSSVHYFEDFDVKRAKSWIQSHDFLEAKPQMSRKRGVDFFISQAFGTADRINLQFKYPKKEDTAPEYFKLWYLKQNPNYPEDSTRKLIPHVWQQESELASSLLMGIFGSELLHDFQNATVEKENKEETTFFLYTQILKGEKYLYFISTQYDENADFREGEKGYEPQQTFLEIHPLTQLSELLKKAG